MSGRWGLWLVGLVVVGLPVAGKWARHRAPRCALDGIRIEPVYRVRVVGPDGEAQPLCCVKCAGRWVARLPAPPAVVYVTDEADGAEIDAGAAYFVESSVVTNRVTGNDVHSFRDRADAEAHAKAFGGTVLSGANRPFGPPTAAH